MKKVYTLDLKFLKILTSFDAGSINTLYLQPFGTFRVEAV